MCCELSEQSKGRLRQCVRVLRDAVPKSDVGFAMAEWYEVETCDAGGNELPDHACRTLACAFGHCCLDPWFNAEGLRLDDSYSHSHPSMVGIDPSCTSWRICELFFGLPAIAAEYLFGYGEYPTSPDTKPGEVADRIEAFIENPEVPE